MVSRWPLKAGPWSETLVRELQPMTAATAGPRIRARGPGYLLHVEDDRSRIVPLLDDRLQVHSVLFPAPRSRVGLFALRRWLPHYVQEFWFLEKDGWRRFNAADAFPMLYRVLRTLRQKLVQPPVTAAPSASGDSPFKPATCSVEPTPAWYRWIDADNRTLSHHGSTAERPLRITHYLGALYCGGAERQLCNLALGLQEHGHQVRVLTGYPRIDEGNHYYELLSKHGVPIRQAELRALPRKSRRVFVDALFRTLPHEIREFVGSLYAELCVERPDILHCWLDQPNIIGAIAGLLAGVPRIVIGFRNSNPTHFPRFHRPYMLPWYRLLAKSRRVEFISNSHSGVTSYASWIGFAKARVHVVANGICPDHFPVPTEEKRQTARRFFGLSPEHKVVCGIFRLDEQKQPDLFLEVVRRTAARVEGSKFSLPASVLWKSRCEQLLSATE
jgi:hypothetical protein